MTTTTDPHAPRAVERHASGAITVHTRACACHPGRRDETIHLDPEAARAYDARTAEKAAEAEATTRRADADVPLSADDLALILRALDSYGDTVLDDPRASEAEATAEADDARDVRVRLAPMLTATPDYPGALTLTRRSAV